MQKNPHITLRAATPSDYPAMTALWNQCIDRGEVVYSPMEEARFAQMLDLPGRTMLIAEVDGTFAGWIHGMTDNSDTGYLTVIFVEPAYRRQGIAKALLERLEAFFRQVGKRVAACSGNNPVHLDWRVPGTPGHDHNNAPGVDKDCAGYPFLIAEGYEPLFHEVSMYMDLKDYKWPEKMDEIHERLQAEGIFVGPYDGIQELEFDGMCDRVGSDYWRNVLKTELEAWKRKAPNADKTLWVDGVPPKGPRPLLLAVRRNQIVGFTGPVDVQKSGRGWFTGICVDPDFGRRSIGALLFHLLMQEFIRQGAAFTTLFTGAENHAQQIYARAGLSVVRSFAVMAKPLVEGAQYGEAHF